MHVFASPVESAENRETTMHMIWIVAVVSTPILVPVAWALACLRRWDPLDFLNELADPGNYGMHRRAAFPLPPSPAGKDCWRDLPETKNNRGVCAPIGRTVRARPKHREFVGRQSSTR
jgi:hypothetical protein